MIGGTSLNILMVYFLIGSVYSIVKFEIQDHAQESKVIKTRFDLLMVMLFALPFAFVAMIRLSILKLSDAYQWLSQNR